MCFSKMVGKCGSRLRVKEMHTQSQRLCCFNWRSWLVSKGTLSAPSWYFNTSIVCITLTFSLRLQTSSNNSVGWMASHPNELPKALIHSRQPYKESRLAWICLWKNAVERPLRNQTPNQNDSKTFQQQGNNQRKNN